MTKIFSLMALLVVFCAQPAKADNSNATAVPGNPLLAHGGGWRFVGCVHDEHECDHLAHSYGYFNHFSRHDFMCHHGDELHSCYAR